jgi:hypothetical protein
MIFTRNHTTGAITACAIKFGRLVRQVYQGYTLQEAKAEFKIYLKELKDD